MPLPEARTASEGSPQTLFLTSSKLSLPRLIPTLIRGLVSVESHLESSQIPNTRRTFSVPKLLRAELSAQQVEETSEERAKLEVTENDGRNPRLPIASLDVPASQVATADPRDPGCKRVPFQEKG